MNLPQPIAAPGSAHLLADRWRAVALADGWLRPDEWHSLAIAPVVEALLTGDGLEQAAGDLGADRASQGIGIAEGLRDLAGLYRAADAGELPFRLARAFAERWSEVTTSALLMQGVTDALTGLRTRDYLAARLKELYSDEFETGVRASDAWRLVTIIGDPVEGWSRILRSSAIARVMSEVLSAGQCNTVLPSGAFVSVVRVGTVDEHSIRLRHRLLGTDDMDTVEVTTSELPEVLDEALDLVWSL